MDWLPVPASLRQRFQVVEPFGHGQSGSMYLVDEPETGRRGVLKLLTPIALGANSQLAERQRLRRELVKQATLTRSHLVVPLASGESEGSTWIFREWLDGVSLEVRLSREGALQQTEALAIAAQIASALDELHRGGLLHRDVKPGHIFLQPTPHGIPRALLLDAGVAGTFTDGATTLLGTSGYVAPEQLLGKLVSFRSDLYSLGCVLYRMLTGRPAFPGESPEQTLIAQRFGDLPPTPADLPNGIGALLQSILAKDPQQRPFSAQKLRRTLDPFLPDGALMEKQPTTTFETVPEPSSSIAPPSGTLKPPPPVSAREPEGSRAPSPRASMPAPPLPPDPVLRPRVSSAPPPAPPSRKAREESTQQIDIAMLQEVLPAPKRPLSVPPPTPGLSKSVPPPAPPLPRAAIPVTDKTQPIRLDQILAVQDARRASEKQPPRLQDEDATGVFNPKHLTPTHRNTESAQLGLAQSSAPEPAALFTAQDEPFGAPPASTAGHDAAALFATHDPHSSVSASSSQVADRSQTELDAIDELLQLDDVVDESAEAQADRELDEHEEQPDDSEEQPDDSEQEELVEQDAQDLSLESEQPLMTAARVAPLPAFGDAHSSASAPVFKGTLMGMGSAPLAASSFELPSESYDAEPELPDEPGSAAAPTTERDHPTERVPHVSNLEDSDERGSSYATSSMPAGTLSQLGARRDPRRMLMYASAALVGLAVLGVGASALRGKPEPVASRDESPSTPPALPAMVVAAAPAVAEPAQAPRPTVESLAPSPATLADTTARAEPVAAPAAAPVTAAPTPAVEPLAPRVEALAAVAATSHAAAAAAEPSQPDVKLTAAERREAKREARHARRKSEASTASAPAKARSSASGSDKEHAKGTDKAALFAAARDEARSAYAAKNYKEAAAAYERASKYDPKHAGTFAGLGAARLQQGDAKAAVAAYQRATQLSPETSGFQAALGRAQLAAGDKAKALAAYKKALALDPKNDAAKLAIKQIGG